MDETGIDFSFIAVVYENSVGTEPTGQDAMDYAAALGNPALPVLADPSLQVLDVTEFDGTVFPSQCALSPEMEMLKCTEGHGHDDLFDVIREHAQSNR